MTYLLSASSLCSRFGFSDGDIFSEDEFDQRLFLGHGMWISHHLPLIAAVRKYLVPKLDSRVVIEEINTHHNPIRASDETKQFVDKSIEVELTFDEVWAAFAEAYPDDAARAAEKGGAA